MVGAMSVQPPPSEVVLTARFSLSLAEESNEFGAVKVNP